MYISLLQASFVQPLVTHVRFQHKDWCVFTARMGLLIPNILKFVEAKDFLAFILEKKLGKLLPDTKTDHDFV